MRQEPTRIYFSNDQITIQTTEVYQRKVTRWLHYSFTNETTNNIPRLEHIIAELMVTERLESQRALLFTGFSMSYKVQLVELQRGMNKRHAEEGRLIQLLFVVCILFLFSFLFIHHFLIETSLIFFLFLYFGLSPR